MMIDRGVGHRRRAVVGVGRHHTQFQVDWIDALGLVRPPFGGTVLVFVFVGFASEHSIELAMTGACGMCCRKRVSQAPRGHWGLGGRGRENRQLRTNIDSPE